MTNSSPRNWPPGRVAGGFGSPPVGVMAGRPHQWPRERRTAAAGTGAYEILQDAVWHIDATEHQRAGAPPKVVRNLGWGGPALNCRSGSTTVPDTNDPLFLPYYGTPYLYLPGLAGNTVACTAPATATQYVAVAIDGSTATGSATGGAAFAFSTGGSWAAVELRNSGNATVARFDASALTTGAATSQTDAYSVAWTINRATSGRKTVVVTSACWLFGTDDWMVVGSGLDQALQIGPNDDFFIFCVVRQWATVSAQYLMNRSDVNTASMVGWCLFNNSGANESSRFGDGQTRLVPADNTALSLGSVTMRTLGRSRARYSGMASVGPVPSSAMDRTGSLVNRSVLLTVGNTYNQPDMELVSAAFFRRALTTSELSTLSTYYQGRWP